MEQAGTQNQAMPTEGTNTTNSSESNTGANITGGKPGPGVTQAGENNSIKEAAAEARRRLKIDDQEVDEEEVVKVYKERKGHQRVANKELQEGRAAKKQAEEFISMMRDKQKLFDVLKKLGHDPRQLSEEYLTNVLEEEMLDPREKELRDYKRKLQQYEDLEKKQQEEIIKRRDEMLKKKFADDYTAQFIEALKTTGLPPTKAMVSEMAKYIARASKLKFQMTAEEAAKLVKEDIELAHKNLYGEADAETLVRLIGEQGLQKVRAYDTGRLKDPSAMLQTPKEQSEVTRKRENGKRMSPQEWREYNRK